MTSFFPRTVIPVSQNRDFYSQSVCDASKSVRPSTVRRMSELRFGSEQLLPKPTTKIFDNELLDFLNRFTCHAVDWLLS